jgi:ABC-2 type transport system ATP-binding protein
MQRRVGIAQALVNSPELLLLDEPTTGLDPAERDRFHALLRQLSATTTVVLASHLMADVHACYDSVLVLCTSRKAFLGSPQALQAAGGYAAVVAGSAHAGNAH